MTMLRTSRWGPGHIGSTSRPSSSLAAFTPGQKRHGGAMSFLGRRKRRPLTHHYNAHVPYVGQQHRRTVSIFPNRRGTRLASVENDTNLYGLGLDFLTFLGATVVVVPVAKKLNISPVLGFLASGFALQQFGLFKDLQDMEKLSELGVLFLLFEMGLELSLDRLKALSKYAFGIGSLQVIITTTVFAAFALPAGNSLGTRFLEMFAGAAPNLVSIRTLDEAVVIGAALSMSSSAFVLQLLRERGELSLRFGSAILGILLFQDIAVVPFLVLLPLIENNTTVGLVAGATPVSLVKMLGPVALQTVAGLGALLVGGRLIVRRIFQVVAESRNSETFVALCLLTVAGASLLTQRLGFSDTLGAFIAGVLLSETNYKTQVEADISAFRGLLLGLFFVTTGSSINVEVLMRDWPSIFWILAGLLVIKTTIIMAVSRPFGLTRSESIRTGFLMSQSGEFAFVLLSLANTLQVLPEDLNQLLIIVVVFSMALTPALAELGKITSEWLDRLLTPKAAAAEEGNKDALEAKAELNHVMGEPVVICGFGPASQMVVNMLESPLATAASEPRTGNIPYVAFDLDPARVRASRKAGFAVVFGDGSRTSVLRAAGVVRPRALLVCYSEKERALKAVEALRLAHPDVSIYAAAVDLSHAADLEVAGADWAVVSGMATGLNLGTKLLDQLGVTEVSRDVVRRGLDDALRKRTSELAHRLTQMPRPLALAGAGSHADVFKMDASTFPSHIKALDSSTAVTAVMDDYDGLASPMASFEVAAVVRTNERAAGGSSSTTHDHSDTGPVGGSATQQSADALGSMGESVMASLSGDMPVGLRSKDGSGFSGGRGEAVASGSGYSSSAPAALRKVASWAASRGDDDDL